MSRNFWRLKATNKMVDNEKDTYRKSGEINANYNYYDFAEGTGIKEFYGSAVTHGGVSTVYILSGTRDYSDERGYVMGSGSGVILDLDFDLTPMNTPKIINGIVTISVPWHINPFSGPVVLTATLYRVRNGVEKSLGTENISLAAIGVGYYLPHFKLTSITNEIIDAMDIIRLNLTVNSTGNSTVWIAMQPMDIDCMGPSAGEPFFDIPTNISSTMLKIDIPFGISN